MDRRKFLNALTCIGVATALPTIASNGEPPLASPFVPLEPISPAIEALCLADSDPVPRVGVIAVGGPGGRVMSSLLARLPSQTLSVAIDKDWAELNCLNADRKLLIDEEWRRLRDGNGAKLLADTSRAQISEAVNQLDIAFIIVGMADIRGAAQARVVAEILRERRTITIVAAIAPCDFDARHREDISLKGIHALERYATAVFPIPNTQLRMFVPEKFSGSGSWGLDDSTAMVEKLFRAFIQPITRRGLVTHGLDTFHEIMTEYRYGTMGCGSAYGRNAAAIAVHRAVAPSALGIEHLSNASGIYVVIEGHPDELKMRSVNTVLNTIRETIGEVPHEQTIYGSAIWNDMLPGEFRVTILAGGSKEV